jgi:Flp pilus assembly pilin Flp
MRRVISKISAFLGDDTAATASEYALILALIAIGLFLGVGTLKVQIAGAMQRAASVIETAS